MSAASELMGALHGALVDDGDVARLLGGRIHDRVPDRPVFPYLTYGGLRSRALDGEGLVEHVVTLAAWSRERGRGEALAVADAVSRALSRALAWPIALGGEHRLVSLRVVSSRSEGGRDDVERVALSLRAVTEPLGAIIQQ